jgi:ketosteroid isomerase-like protein
MRRGFERFNDRDWEGYELPDDFEFEAPPDLPGSGTYRGRDGLRRFAAEVEEGFVSLRAEPLDVVAAGAGAVVVRTRIVGRGRHTGLDINREEFHVLTLDRDEVVHAHRCFADRADAMRAANLAD